MSVRGSRRRDLQTIEAWSHLAAVVQHIRKGRRVIVTHGPNLGRPYADHIKQSRHANMKELRATAGLAHLRVLYAFDPQRTALLLILGDKSPNDETSPNWAAWYDTMVPIADRLFTEHLDTL